MERRRDRRGQGERSRGWGGGEENGKMMWQSLGDRLRIGRRASGVWYGRDRWAAPRNLSWYQWIGFEHRTSRERGLVRPGPMGGPLKPILVPMDRFREVPSLRLGLA